MKKIFMIGLGCQKNMDGHIVVAGENYATGK